MDFSGDVHSTVGDERLVEERRRQILHAAVKLFSAKGFYRTTIIDIAKEAGISSGLIYKYFEEKEDVLYLSLMLVLETYEREIPAKTAGIESPVAQLCAVLRAYCGIVDKLRDATILAYRSTKSLPKSRRVNVKKSEERTNKIVHDCLTQCVEAGLMKPVDLNLLVYQYVMFCHAWALKHWSFRDHYSVDEYVDGGIALLVEPLLTKKGRKALAVASGAEKPKGGK